MRKSVCVGVVISIMATQLVGCAFIPEKKVKQTVQSSGGEFVIDTSLAESMNTDGESSGNMFFEGSEDENTVEPPNIATKDGLIELTLEPYLMEAGSVEEILPELMVDQVEFIQNDDGSVTARMDAETYMGIVFIPTMKITEIDADLQEKLTEYSYESDDHSMTIYLHKEELNENIINQTDEIAIESITCAILIGSGKDDLYVTMRIADILDPSNILYEKDWTVNEWLNR